MSKLKKGDILKSIYDITYNVDRFLAAGGQGSVYKVSQGSKTYALKWYTTRTIEKIMRFKKLLNSSPKLANKTDDKRFVWPQDLIDTNDGFGYIMSLIDMKKYLTLHKLTYLMYINNENKVSKKVLCDICINLAEAFKNLHDGGKCYKDISPNNIIFDINSGEVLIFDVDNVVTSGEKGDVKGTPKFMAPEVVAGTKDPDKDTDKFSLASYFFHLLVGHYPFEGKLRDEYKKKHGVIDENGFNYLYGSNAVFCFNPKDKSNSLEGDADYQPIVDRWNYSVPQKLKDRFLKTFVDGLPVNLRSERTTDGAWIKLFNEFKQNIVKCQCKKEYFPGAIKCLDCGKMLPLSSQQTTPTNTKQPQTPALPSGNSSIKISIKERAVPNNVEYVVKNKTIINGKSIAKCLSQFSNFAEVVTNPKTGALGLKNLSVLTWYYKDPSDTELKEVSNKAIVGLRKGRVIAFIKREVQITVL